MSAQVWTIWDELTLDSNSGEVAQRSCAYEVASCRTLITAWYAELELWNISRGETILRFTSEQRVTSTSVPKEENIKSGNQLSGFLRFLYLHSMDHASGSTGLPSKEIGRLLRWTREIYLNRWSFILNK